MSNAKMPMKESVVAVLRSADGRVRRIEPRRRRSWGTTLVWPIVLVASLAAWLVKEGLG